MRALIDASPPYLLSVAAAVCLGLAVWLACRDRLKAATLLGVLFFLCVTLAYFPQLDSINAIGVNVRLARNVESAKEILEQLKQVAVINAKSTSMELAWGNRMGSPSAREKQAMLDASNSQLAALGVSDAERREIAEPIVEFIGVDLYQIYHSVFERLLEWKKQELARQNAAPGNPEIQKALQAFENNRIEWEHLAVRGPYENLKAYDLSAYLHATIPTKLLDDKENATAERFKSEVASVYEGCRAKGGYTSEATQYFDRYGDYPGGIDLKIKELFGVDTSAVR